MASPIAATGKCLCGSVTVAVELDKNTFDACRCRFLSNLNRNVMNLRIRLKL